MYENIRVPPPPPRQGQAFPISTKISCAGSLFVLKRNILQRALSLFPFQPADEILVLFAIVTSEGLHTYNMEVCEGSGHYSEHLSLSLDVAADVA